MRNFEDVFAVRADHPALSGHFPDDPIVPGALIIDEAVAAIRRHGRWRIRGVRQAKFSSPLPVDAPCTLHVAQRDEGSLAVSCTVDGELVASAIFDCDPTTVPS